MSLADRLLSRLRENEPPALEIISGRCLRSRFQESSCDRCIRECPTQAIRCTPGTVAIDPKLCAGCLACAAVCPSAALAGNDSRFTAAPAIAAKKTVTLCCAKAVRNGEEIILPCLGALSEGQLLALAVRSAAGVSLRLSRCGNCRASFVPDLLDRRLRILENKPGCKRFASLVRLIRREEEEDGPGQAAKAEDRRAFFRAFWQLSRHTATETITTLQNKPNLQGKTAHKHQPLHLDLLRQTMAGATDEAALAILQLFFTLTVRPNCNFCGACAGMCPTGAIKNRRTEEGKQLHFAWSRCSGCGLCVEFCRKKALTLVPGRTLESIGTETEALHEAAHE